jgi:hypothetical protein
VQQQYAGFVARGDELFTGLRGEDEPGLATFDDDEPDIGGGFRESAFDRAADAVDGEPGDAEVRQLPADPPADAVTAAVDDLADAVEDGRQSIEELVQEAPEIEEILDQIAIDELVDQAPTLDETAPTADADTTADVSTTVDVLTADGAVAPVDAAVTDEGIATAPEAAATSPEATAAAPEATATDEGGTPVAAATGVRTDVAETDTSADSSATAEVGSDLTRSQAAGSAPIDGYDDFSIAQLRGRLRGYQLSTVQDLLAYEEATRAREPYLRMLRNRLEKLQQQAVESSPLAPRG